MNASTLTRHQRLSDIARTSKHGRSRIEPLERRALMSAWPTAVAGDVYAAGAMSVTTVTSSNGNKTTAPTISYAVVLKLAAGQHNFSTVDQCLLTGLAFTGVSVINAGTSAGVYVVGSSGRNW